MCFRFFKTMRRYVLCHVLSVSRICIRSSRKKGIETKGGIQFQVFLI